MAKEKGVTPAQLVLAWLLAQGDESSDPRHQARERLEENAGAIGI